MQTPDEVAAMLRLKALGWGVRRIAGELGVSVRGNLLYSGLSQTPSGFSRGLSNFTLDEPLAMRRWVAGDGFSSTGTLGGSLLLGGVSVSRNFALDPYFVRTPLPRVSGAVLTPSTLDVYVNGVLVRREPLPPGPFEIANLPVTSGLSGVRYVVHDAFGRTQEYSTRAYSSPTVLAKGLSDYSYGVGLRREDFGTASFSYGRAALMAQHRLGLTDRMTGGYRLEADPGLLSAGPSLSVALPLGQLDLAAAGSVADGGIGAGGSLGYVLVMRPAAVEIAQVRIDAGLQPMGRKRCFEDQLGFFAEARLTVVEKIPESKLDAAFQHPKGFAGLRPLGKRRLPFDHQPIDGRLKPSRNRPGSATVATSAGH